MKLLFFSALDAPGASFAEELSSTHTVMVIHPDEWDLEGSFSHQAVNGFRELDYDSFSREYDAFIILSCNDKMADAMNDVLNLCSGKQVQKLICIHSRPLLESYVNRKSIDECVCEAHQQNGESNIAFMDIPALYGDDFLPAELEAAVQSSQKSNYLHLKGSHLSVCDLLHVQDLASAVNILLDAPDMKHSVFLTSEQSITREMLASCIRNAYQFVNIGCADPAEDPSETSGRFHSDLPGWMPRHTVSEEIPSVFSALQDKSGIDRETQSKKVSVHIRKIAVFLIAFLCLWAYTNFLKVSSELQFVDVRLLFIIAMSLFLGKGYGLAAGIVCSVSSVLDSIMAGYEWHTIFFHVDNWIPIAVYLASAVLFGMYNDNRSKSERSVEEDHP